MTARPAPTTVTMIIKDNPLAGLPGQVDYTITVSAEPDLPLPGPGQDLPDPDGLPSSVLAATSMLAHITGASLEATFMKIVTDSASSN